ncbi:MULTISPECIES: hypothetical protein [Spirulina sp. CCY15215]|uniref:hypothetical protein n=1 Tax=Spirulina sp. CCY15215 TaxID=2767591 RepID=UPI0019524C5D|nr:hypothetical protein [Spirulina major]
MYAQKGRAYWFCPDCRQEMPDLLSVMMTANQARHKVKSLSSPLLPELLPEPAELH